MVLSKPEEDKSVGAEINDFDSTETSSLKGETKKDEKLVVFSRIFVVAVMTMLAFVMALTAYRVISNDEQTDFIAEFEASAGQVAFMTTKYAENVHTSVKTMATAYPSTVSAYESAAISLPMVTLANYDALAQGAKSLAKVSALWYAPFLTTETSLAEWNQYTANHSNNTTTHRVDQVYRIDNVTGDTVTETGNGVFAPLWQVFPAPVNTSLINLNLASDEAFAQDLVHMVTRGQPVLSKPLVTMAPLLEMDGSEGSVSLLLHPVFSSLDEDDEKRIVVGVLTALISWREFLTCVLPPGQDNILVVMESCGVQNTFVVHGTESEFVGQGDLHNPLYDDLKVHVSLDFGLTPENDDKYHHCYPIINIYPTDDLKLRFGTSTAFYYATIIVVMFIVMGIVFLVYDWFVTNRQSNTEHIARKTNAIVQELFPGNVAAKLYNAKDVRNEDGKKIAGDAGTFGQAGNSTIAQLHPAATVLFADIAGFTAWSSMRDPHQVFTLLENIFQAFDAVAKKRDIFKVETIGDCYVAVCGVPKANPQHAVQMARFARTAMDKFDKVIRSLELKLGPDTVDLGMRVGMHSGPVTAGVLRGERARFQLFGDTVNTASRIESTGVRDKIHLSEQTATELIKEGKQDWIVAREDVVEAKGKGKLKTYWLKSNAERLATSAGIGSSDTSESKSSEGEVVVDSNNPDQLIEHHSSLLGKRSKERHGMAPAKHQQRLIEWNTALLLELLRQVVAHRQISCGDSESSSLNLDDMAIDIGQGRLIVDEVTDTIQIPIVEKRSQVAEVRLSGEVAQQLRRYVGYIATSYNNHPFHNFEHASHVTMSVSKLLSRIVESHDASNESSDNQGHNPSVMINPDPLTQFAVVLAALVHDVDHAGVSNIQLVAENPILANLYDNRCVAEQNSVDVAWKALMSSDYDDLRATIFSTEAELRLFRQIIVNSVIATDIFDGDLSASRKLRWNEAFTYAAESPCDDLRHHQAAVITDSLIQASDVAHTMQHWQVFQKWNQRLFDEMLTAFRNGRCEADPTESWYEGELSFFDNYVVPLAQKLKDCGVFGVSGDEYLTYARQNRSEWEVKGHAIVQQYVIDFEKKQAIGKNSASGRGNMIRRGSMRVIRTARHWFADSERSLNASFSTSFRES